MDIISVLNDMITSGLGLALVAGAYLLWWLSGFIPNLFSDRIWSWKRGLEDFCKALLMGILLVAGTGLLNAGGQFFAMLGWDITQGIDTFNTFALIGAMASGFILYMKKALTNGWNFFKLTASNLQGNKEKFKEGKSQIGQDVRDAVSALYLSFSTPHEDSTVKAGLLTTAKQALRLAEMGATTYVKLPCATPAEFYNAALGRGFDEGWGKQCVAGFKEFMYSLTGKYVSAGGAASGYAYEPARSAVCKLGFTWHDGPADLQDGDWGVWVTGAYGHVSMYYQGKWFGQNQGAKDGNVGNAFNLMALPMEGFVGYFRPNAYSKATIKPTTDTKPSAINKDVIEYTYKSGDTFGQVLLNLGLATSQTLWGKNGDVEYYTNQLHEQGIWGNVPVGQVIKLTPRK